MAAIVSADTPLPYHRAGHALMNRFGLTAAEATGALSAATREPGRPVRARSAEVTMTAAPDSHGYTVRDMTERDALRVLLGKTAGPSARTDAEITLRSLGWPELAILIARNAGPEAQHVLRNADPRYDRPDRESVLRRFAPPAPWQPQD